MKHSVVSILVVLYLSGCGAQERSGRGGVVTQLSLFRIRVDSKPRIDTDWPTSSDKALSLHAIGYHASHLLDILPFLSTTNNSHTTLCSASPNRLWYTYARKRASQSPFPCTAYHVSVLLTVVNFSWPITVITTCRYQSLFPTRFPRASYSTTSPLLRPCFICIYVTAVSLARNLHPGILTSQYVSRARCFVEING